MTACAARRTIGVDMGGTKLLAGAVDEGLGVHHRAQRTLTGLDPPALLDIAVEAVQEARGIRGRGDRGGRFRDPEPDRPADRHRR